MSDFTCQTCRWRRRDRCLVLRREVKETECRLWDPIGEERLYQQPWFESSSLAECELYGENNDSED